PRVEAPARSDAAAHRVSDPGPRAPPRGARRRRRGPPRFAVLRRRRGGAAHRARVAHGVCPAPRGGRGHPRRALQAGGVPAVASPVLPGRGRAAGRRDLDVARPRDPRRRKRRDHRRLPPAPRPGAQARVGHEGRRLDPDARLGRLRRAGGPDDADGRRDRLARRPGAPRHGPRAAHLARRRDRRGHGGGLPDPARRGAPRRRDPAPRRLRDRRAHPGRTRERRQLLDVHRLLRRAHALRPRADVPVRPRASAALRDPRGRRLDRRERVPGWCKPGLGGLALGLVATPVIVLIGPRLGQPGQGLGILGGGYGAAQLAIAGAEWFPLGWRGAELLALLGAVKIVATCFTVGTGGSAGDFGPSLVIGGLVCGAFGRAAQLLLHDPRIDPGAFALVGMGTFYGGLAHVPIASLVTTSELAGSYDLLVPLMFAEGIAFVALRNRSLYHAQVATKREPPAHRDELIFDVLTGVRVGDVLVRDRPYATF